MTQKHIDFHTHTHYSDGIGTPEDNIKLARFNGLDYIAITDHDNMAGVAEAIEAGKKWGIHVIPGIEISTEDYHILGLNINPADKEFIRKSAEFQRRVCASRVELLAEQGIPITMEKVERANPDARLGKMNIFYTIAQDAECQRYFFKNDIYSLSYDGYSELLKKSKRAVSDKETEVSPTKAIDFIHEAGGIAIIAHPFKDIENLEELDVLIDQGLDGLEIQPNFNGQNEQCRKYALEHNLLVTYGSDWHGGLFGRPMLWSKGENVLSEKLAEALGLEVLQNA